MKAVGIEILHCSISWLHCWAVCWFGKFILLGIPVTMIKLLTFI